MKRSFKKYVVVMVVAVLIVISVIVQTACAPAKEIVLYDYKNVTIPAEVYTASESDVDAAVYFMLMEKEVFVTKTENGGLAEEGDVVEATCRRTSGEIEELTLCIGAGAEPELEAAAIGKAEGADITIMNNHSWIDIHINSVKCFADELTNDIARSYFDGKSISALRDEARADIEAHRRFEYVVNALSEKSTVKGYDKEMHQYVNRVCSTITKHLSEEGVTLSEYVDEVYGISVSGYKDAIKENYRNYLIFKEVIEEEGLTVTEELYSGCLNDYADAWGLSIEEAEELYGNEYIYLQVCLDLLFDVMQQTSGLE